MSTDFVRVVVSIRDYAIMSLFFFFNDTATTEIYTLSLHDALPISPGGVIDHRHLALRIGGRHVLRVPLRHMEFGRSEEHTSELQSPCNLVCRLLLEKKKNNSISTSTSTDRSAMRHQPIRFLTIWSP